jgi:hypothetical protein
VMPCDAQFTVVAHSRALSMPLLDPTKKRWGAFKNNWSVTATE